MLIFSSKELGSTAPSPITQEQHDWLGICILGAYDLYCTRNADVPWVAGELTRFIADAKTVYPSCSAPVQAALNGFMLGSGAFAPAQVRTNWKNLLINQNSFGGQTFGAWLKNLNVSSLLWNQSVLTPNDLLLGFYTVLFFCDLESLFVGTAANLDAYWGLPPNMPIHSAQVLVSHYYVQGGGNTPAYTTSLSSVASIVDCTNFHYAPYSPSYTNFVGLMNSYVSEGYKPTWVDPAVPYIPQASGFAFFANLSATSAVSVPTVPPASTPPISSGLNDLGNYLDGVASVARQLLVVGPDVQAVFANNNYNAQKAALEAAANTTAPIQDPTKDSLFAIVSTPPPDVTSPYAGMYMSLFFMNYPSPTPPPYGMMANLHFCVDLGNYTFMLTDGDGNALYSNSPLQPDPFQPAASPIPFSFAGYDGSHDGESGYTMTQTDASANPGVSKSGSSLAAVWNAYMADE